MDKADTAEAAPLCDRILAGLVKVVPPSGRPGSDARTAIGDVRAHLEELLRNDQLGPPLDNCFELVRLSGALWVNMADLRRQIELQNAVSVGAIMVKQAAVNFCLATEGRMIVDMTFVSRDQVQDVQTSIGECFNDAEESAADEMDTDTYQALIHLHAAIIQHLVATALPLPRILQFQFAAPLPSLVMAYKLYADAGRADEIRDGNTVWHPAFCLPNGIALSA